MVPHSLRFSKVYEELFRPRFVCFPRLKFLRNFVNFPREKVENH